MEKKHASSLAIRTQQGYESNLNLRVLPSFGHLKVSNIKKVHIQNFFDDLKEDGARIDGKGSKLSNSSINNHHTLLSSIFSFAVDRGYIKENPMRGVKKLKVENKKMNVYQKSDIAALMESLNTAPLNWRTLVILAIVSGARAGELVGLEWQHVNFEKETILIEQSLTLKTGEGVKVKSTKTERSRIVSIPPFVIQLLKELKHEKNKARLQAAEMWIREWDGVERDFVFTTPNAFGRPIRPDSVTQWWERFLKKNDHLKFINFHGLRHTSVSILIDENTPMKAISERVGHAKIGTSMDIYGHLLEEADKRAAASMDKVFGDLGINAGK
ncbi:site-specific integrase [Peribacillus frigoritolerans]|nr:site-specific integrase [Peribacillus frigoritolerans]